MELEIEGAPAHTRTLVISLEAAGPGRIAARGTLLDLRKRGLVPMASDLQTAGVIHDMRVEALLSLAPPRIESIRVEQPSVAFEATPATGGECCRDPADRIAALAGTPLDDEATRRLGASLGGPRGCSHVVTLSQLLIGTARTALALEALRHPDSGRPAGQRLFHRSLSIDAGAVDAGLVLTLQLADVHFTPVVPSAEGDALDRLAGRVEIRARADVDLGGMVLRDLRCAERESDRERFYGAWRDRSERVAELAGRGALGGMAARVFACLGDEPADRPLRDALLHLAPALIQCVPAVLERWQRTPEGERPEMMAGGGMADSCYMWRREGALLAGFEATSPSRSDAD